jgi:hypothetical protein
VDGSEDQPNNNRYVMGIRVTNKDGVTPMIDYDFYNLYQVPNYSTMTTYL